MSEHEENLCTVWEDFPNPRSMDRDDLSEALDQIDPLSFNEAEREVFGDWYREIALDVKEDVALNMPHKVMIAEIVSYADKKAVYKRVIERNAETRHLRREVWALEKTCEQLRGTITVLAKRINDLKEEQRDGSGE